MTLLEGVYRLQFNARQWIVGRCYQRGRLRQSTVTRPISAPKRLLLISSGLIGDTVMSTPVFLEARRLWPDAHITLLGNRVTCELLKPCPLIDDLKTAEAQPFSIRNRQKFKLLRSWVRRQNFDVAMILLGDHFAELLAESGIPTRIGVANHFLQPCLTHTYEIGSARDWGPSERLNALRVFGLEVRDCAPQLWVCDVARHHAQRALGDLGMRKQDSYIVLHPFGSCRQQWWPMERVSKIVSEVWDRYRWKTVLVGGPELKEVLVSSNQAVNAIGRLNIAELLAVIENSKLVITTDSGPFHISGALKRPIIGLFRARRPEHANRYACAQVLFGQHDECTEHCKWNKCRQTPCQQLAQLSTKAVLNALECCGVVQ
jgi:ADP-heptose:LPS heptosyltransferase